MYGIAWLAYVTFCELVIYMAVANARHFWPALVGAICLVTLMTVGFLIVRDLIWRLR